MKQLILLFGILLCLGCNDNSNDEAEILGIMKMQEQAWTENNIEEFMKGYWKSDSLKFFGASGITYGWQQTLDNYKKRYPTAEHTGDLKFTIEDITRVQDDSYYAMGRYHLKRSIGDAEGVFMIIFKKIEGEWKIIADLSC